MYDSTNAAAIPLSAGLVLTYIDGNYRTDAAVAARIPHARRVPTTVTVPGSLLAQIFDCERGDGNAYQAVQWADRKLSLYQRPTIYCSRLGSTGYGWPWVLAELHNANLPPSLIDFGIADYTGMPHLVPGSAFTQYANPATSGGDYDLSLTNGIWPNTAPPNITGDNVTSSVTTANGVTQLHVFDNVNGKHVHWWQDLAGGPGPLGVWHVEDMPAAP